MVYQPWVIDERDLNSEEPKSNLSVCYSFEAAKEELEDYLEYAKDNGMRIVKSGIDTEDGVIK